MALVEIKNLSVHYSFIHAVNNININIEKGQIVALLGANGAGKSSTLKAISGEKKPDKQTVIMLEGKNIAGKKSFSVARQGVAISPEGRQVFAALSVEDNLRIGAYHLTGRVVTDDNGVSKKISRRQVYQANLQRVFTLFPILKERIKQQAGTLSGGEQQMLVIGRALMSSPKVLLLDEPSLGLAPLIIKDIFNTLVEIKNQGTTILIVEQNALATLKIADYGYVLELGNVSLEGKASDLIKDSKLIDAYLGGKKG